MSEQVGAGHVTFAPRFVGFRRVVDSEVSSTVASADAAASRGFAAAGTKAGGGFASGFRSATSSLGSGLANVATGITDYILKPLGAVAGAAGIATAALGFNRLVGIDTARSKLNALGMSAGDIQSSMDSALKSVKGTAFGLGDAAGAAASAAAAGVQQGQAMDDYLRSIVDVSAVAGVGLNEVSSIFGKVQSAGRASTGEINQLADRQIPIWQYLADEMGTTTDEVRKFASEGSISAQTFYDAVKNNISGAAVIMGQTSFMGAWQNVLAAVGRVGAAFLDAGGEGGGFFSQLKPIMADVTALLDNLTPKAAEFGVIFGKGFAAVVTEVSGGVKAFSAAWTAFDGDVTSSGFPGFMERLAFVARTVFEELRGGITAFGAAWAANDGEITSSGFPGFMEGLAYVVRQIGDGVAGLDFSSVEGFTSSLGSVGPAFGSIGESVQTLMPAVSAFTAQLPELGGGLLTLASGGINILAAGLSFLADNAETIVAWMPAIVAGFVAWRVASQAVTAAQVAQAPILLASNTLGLSRALIDWNMARASAAATAATAANTGATATNTAARSGGLLATVRSTAALVAQRVALIASSVAQRAAAAAQWLLNAAMSANPITLIIIAIAALVAGLIYFFTQTETGKAVWAEFTRFLGEAWTNIVAVATAVFGFLGEFFTNVWNGIVATVQFVWGLIVGYVTWYIDTTLAIITGVLGAISAAWSFVWNGLVAAFTFIWDLIVLAVTTYINIVLTVINFVLTAIATAWSFVWNGLVAAFTFVWDLIVTAVTTYINIVSTVIATVLAFISTAWNNAWGAISRFFIQIWDTIVSGVEGFVRQVEVNIGRAVNFLEALPEQIMGFFEGIGDWLVDSGKALIQGLLDGIEAMFPGITESVGGVMDFIGGFFPQSPAKRGRFSGRGYTTYSGNALIEDYAGGIEEKLPRLSAAASAAQDAAAISTQVTMTATARPSQGGGDQYFEFHILLERVDGETADQLLERIQQQARFELGGLES